LFEFKLGSSIITEEFYQEFMHFHKMKNFVLMIFLYKINSQNLMKARQKFSSQKKIMRDLNKSLIEHLGLKFQITLEFITKIRKKKRINKIVDY